MTLAWTYWMWTEWLKHQVNHHLHPQQGKRFVAAEHCGIDGLEDSIKEWRCN